MPQTIAGRYELAEILGRGGMGAVWRARDRTLGREVAVKEVSLPDGLDGAQVERVYARTFREARSAARLDHPGIVTVYDVVEEDGRPWIIMQLIRAESLDRVIAREGPQAPGRVAEIGLDLLDALRAAHAAGVVHRDVKPGNVLLPPGRAVLTDFGIATVAGDETLTQAGAVLGSPAYLAPEQAGHQRATPASDLWSLGATLYAAVEGRAPYSRPDLWGVMAALLAEEPDPLRLAGPLTPVIQGLLRKNPDERTAPDEVGRMLRRITQGPVPGPAQAGPRNVTLDPAVTAAEPPTPQPGPLGGPSAASRGSRRPVIFAAGAVAVLLVSVAAVVLFLDLRGDQGGQASKTPRPGGGSGRGSPQSTSTAVPPGYKEYRGPAYVAAVPDRWRQTEEGDTVEFYDPVRGGEGHGISLSPADYGTVDLGDLLATASGAFENDGEYPGYKEVGLKRNLAYKDGKAAELEFTFLQNKIPAHGRIRMFRIDGAAYQVIMVAYEENWKASLPHFDTFFRTFRSAPSSSRSPRTGSSP
ncbi:serine/threonine-protein kinase [Spirillospora sp. NPDC048819]|uniref:serine/threonine-protein kinase n=1 Tax=Spirillospora sp. NPDC048819 TaxID=3155268 RepID=UPI003411D63E